jgi:hypothetical protein
MTSGKIVARWQIKNASVVYNLRKLWGEMYQLKRDTGMISEYRQIKANSAVDAINKAERRVQLEVERDVMLKKHRLDLVFINKAA